MPVLPAHTGNRKTVRGRETNMTISMANYVLRFDVDNLNDVN